MPEARVELARGCPRRILSPLRLPFRHSGRAGNIVRDPRPRKPKPQGCNRLPGGVTIPFSEAGNVSPPPEDQIMPVVPTRGLHPWHDIPTGRNPPVEVTAVGEIPTHQRKQEQLDNKAG